MFAALGYARGRMSARVTAGSVAAAGLLAALGLASSAARAQTTDAAGEDAASVHARARYNAGSKAFAERRFVEAALDFEAAAADKPSPVALYTAALSWEQANVPDRAADDYTRALAAPSLSGDKEGLARERLGALEEVLGAVTVVGADGARVQLDANTELPVPATLHAAAGVHTLSARMGGDPVARRPVVLERGKTAKLDLSFPPPSMPAREAQAALRAPAPARVALPASDAIGWRPAAGFTAVGVGGAMLLAGLVLGSEAVGARDAYRGAPTQATYDHATELQMWTNVAFVGGSVLAAGGIALLVWPSPSRDRGTQAAKVSLVPGPGRLLVTGAF
jgi:hypothetical protein